MRQKPFLVRCSPCKGFGHIQNVGIKTVNMMSRHFCGGIQSLQNTRRFSFLHKCACRCAWGCKLFVPVADFRPHQRKVFMNLRYIGSRLTHVHGVTVVACTDQIFESIFNVVWTSLNYCTAFSFRTSLDLVISASLSNAFKVVC